MGRIVKHRPGPMQSPMPCHAMVPYGPHPGLAPSLQGFISIVGFGRVYQSALVHDTPPEGRPGSDVTGAACGSDAQTIY